MDERELSTVLKEQETTTEMDEARPEEVALTDLSNTEERAGRGQRREKKLQVKRKRRAQKITKKAAKETSPSDLDLTGKQSKAEFAAMYRHWKRVHEISGSIVASLEEFSHHVKNR